MSETREAGADGSEQLKASRKKIRQLRDALNLLGQSAFSVVAADYVRRGAKFATQPAVAKLIEDGDLFPHVFSQKTGPIMQFYRHLLAGMDAPRAVFEIGVKNGGSLALWKQLFPDARIVGLDLKLSKVVRHDGIVYVEGDQTDTALLEKIAAEHGPFGLVIDDGSHVGEHQLISLTALAPHVVPGGTYVIEDVHTALKPGERGALYGADVWADFLGFLFDRLRSRWHGAEEAAYVANAGAAVRVAAEVGPSVSDVTLAHHVLALCFRDRREPASAELAEAQATMSVVAD